MRKDFLEPEMEVIQFGTDDIITTSVGVEDDFVDENIDEEGEFGDIE